MNYFHSFEAIQIKFGRLYDLDSRPAKTQKDAFKKVGRHFLLMQGIHAQTLAKVMKIMIRPDATLNFDQKVDFLTQKCKNVKNYDFPVFP